MTDSDVLKLLASLGMDDLSFRVLPVLPLVQVAWADGEVQEPEKANIQVFAEKFSPGREGQLLVDNWLAYRPTDAYFQRGFAALAAMTGRGDSPLSLPTGAVEQAQQAAREVAKAHGGFFGFGAISRPEAEALAAIKELLESATPGEVVQVAPRRRVTITCNTSTFDTSAENAVLVPDMAPEYRVPVDEKGVVVGSAAEAVMRIENDPLVAGTHSRLFSESRRFYVEDLGSRTGTFVDGERVVKRRLLGGEKLQIGEATFLFKFLRRVPLQMIS